MTKFTAQSASEFRTVKANHGRFARECGYVVLVEADDGSWCELDADHRQHARTLADNWVEKMNARGCSCWMVNQKNGKLMNKSFYMKFADNWIDGVEM